MTTYDVRVAGTGTIARVTSLAAADAVERLYEMAWARGERPMMGCVTFVSPDNGYRHVPTEDPMTDGEVEAWFNEIAGPRGCAYCGGEHRSDKCLDVMQAEERRR